VVNGSSIPTRHLHRPEHGLGEAKTSQLKAALEMGRRLGMLQNDEKYQIKPLCSLALVSVHFVLAEGAFCSPCITRDSGYSRV